MLLVAALFVIRIGLGKTKRIGFIVDSIVYGIIVSNYVNFERKVDQTKPYNCTVKMLTKATTRKAEVVIPSEPPQICKWTDEFIKLSIHPNDDNGSLLSQDLLSASKDINMSNKIETLGQLQTSFFDKNTISLSKTNKMGAHPSETRRFIVDIGNNKYHDNNFTQSRTHIIEKEYHQSFRSMIETHSL